MTRSILLEKLYHWSKIPYRWLFKHEPAWNLTPKELFKFPKNSLGYHLGCFLLTYELTLEAQLENHDVFHVLTATGITVPEEIAMQYCLLGNGKRSMYLLGVLITGSILFPEYRSRYVSAFRMGKNAHPFYALNYFKLLPIPLKQLQQTLQIKPHEKKSDFTR